VNYKIFPTTADVAESLASQLAERIGSAFKNKSPLTIALSGGNTPKLLFQILAEKYLKVINWAYVHLFWADERCIQPDDADSNFGMTSELLLRKTDIPGENIHRIRGEDDPQTEASRYSEEILQYTKIRDNLPEFDIVILGMGEDGHTASIFPGNLELLHCEHICEMAIHPVSGQKRITLTGKIINNAREIIFLVTGRSKASVIAEVIGKKPKNLNYPAAHIVSSYGKTTWLLDKEASTLLE